MTPEEYEREIGNLKFALAGARDRAEAAEDSAAQAEQERDDLRRQLEQAQEEINRLHQIIQAGIDRRQWEIEQSKEAF